jgi:hypothetical protein
MMMGGEKTMKRKDIGDTGNEAVCGGKAADLFAANRGEGYILTYSSKKEFSYTSGTDKTPAELPEIRAPGDARGRVLYHTVYMRDGRVFCEAPQDDGSRMLGAYERELRRLNPEVKIYRYAELAEMERIRSRVKKEFASEKPVGKTEFGASIYAFDSTGYGKENRYRLIRGILKETGDVGSRKYKEIIDYDRAIVENMRDADILVRLDESGSAKSCSISDSSSARICRDENLRFEEEYRLVVDYADADILRKIKGVCVYKPEYTAKGCALKFRFLRNNRIKSFRLNNAALDMDSKELTALLFRRNAMSKTFTLSIACDRYIFGLRYEEADRGRGPAPIVSLLDKQEKVYLSTIDAENTELYPE